MIGQIYGRLTVAQKVRKEGDRHAYWRCECECGNERIVVQYDLRNGHTRSCGCLVREMIGARKRTHGESRRRIYFTWQRMMHRCYRAKHKDYPYYGARGITVCAAWHDFKNFYADMGEPPSGLTLERKNNESGYSPDNCCWASRKIQGRNTRRVRLTMETVNQIRAAAADGTKYPQIAALFGISRGHVGNIVRGRCWS
jgi:hypothetical protein